MFPICNAHHSPLAPLVRIACCCAVWLACLLGVVGAQDSKPTESGDSKKAATKNADVLAPEDADLVRLIGEDGKLHVLRAGQTLKRILELMDRSEKTPPTVPDYYIASCVLDGQVDADRDRATLNATFEVQLQPGKSAVRVPLKMPEAVILSRGYEGPGAPQFEDFEKNAGYVCLLSGEGKHVVKLKLAVALRRVGSTQRLQLNLPSSVQTRLVLDVPQSQLTVKATDTAKPNDSLDLQTEVIDAKHSRIIGQGFGSVLDLTWQGVRDATPAKRELQVRTMMQAEILPDDVVLQVGQTVRALQGTFRAVTISIPAGFKVDGVTDKSGTPLSFNLPQVGKALVPLPSETSGPVDLVWQLRSTIGAGNPKVKLAPPMVDEAVRQDGMLGVISPEGFSLRVIDGESHGLERIGAATFRRFADAVLRQGDSSVSHAFSFEGTCQVSLELQRVVASFLVRPSYELTIAADYAEFIATLDLRVFRGAVESLQFKWPKWREEGWQVDVEADVGISHEPGASPDEYVLKFNEPVDRRDANIEIKFRGRRATTAGKGEFPLTLPTVIAPRRPIAALLIKNANNVESKLTPREGTELRLTAAAAGKSDADLRDTPANQRPRRFDLYSDVATFTASVEVHPQRVTCASRSSLTVQDDRIRVTQIFEYDVAYERLADVRIIVPKSLADRIGGLQASFWLVHSPDEVLWQIDGPTAARFSLTPVPTGIDADGRLLRLGLPQPSWGRFRVVAQFSLPLDVAAVGKGGLSAQVPLMHSADAAVDKSQLQIRAPDNVTVKVPSEDWQPEVALERYPTWGAEGLQRSVTLELQVRPTQASNEFSIRKAAFRIRFDQGVARTQAVYQIDGDVRAMSLEMPPKVARNAARFWWDGIELAGEQIRRSENGTDIRLNLQGTSERQWHVFAIDYASEDSPNFGLHNFLKSATPRFASNVWQAESQWEITVPFDQHLFVYPNGLAPRFRWHRQGLIWTRLTREAKAEVVDWVSAGDDAPLPDGSNVMSLVPSSFRSEGSGNRYLFSSYGRLQRIELQTMSQPGIILAGTGLALAIGFLLLRIPATRHVLTFLVLGVAMALLGIWHFEPVQLLLQPALIGVLMAAIAAVVEARIKRTEQFAYVTLSPPSDIILPGSSREERSLAVPVEPIIGQ